MSCTDSIESVSTVRSREQKHEMGCGSTYDQNGLDMLPSEAVLVLTAEEHIYEVCILIFVLLL
jgi:hypothetical protein